jgi:xylan 1,4-beta-xylosidase
VVGERHPLEDLACLFGAALLPYLVADRRVDPRQLLETLPAAFQMEEILHHDLHVTEKDGDPVIDFTRVDGVFDLLGTGLRPVVGIGFMPRDLACDPDRTVFGYRGIISPLQDRTRGAELLRVLVSHLPER